MPTAALLRYGDYPHLFWDLDPAAPVNVRHPVIVRRVLDRGSSQDLRVLDPAITLELLPTLGLKPAVAAFWTDVFRGLSALSVG